MNLQNIFSQSENNGHFLNVIHLAYVLTKEIKKQVYKVTDYILNIDHIHQGKYK